MKRPNIILFIILILLLIIFFINNNNNNITISNFDDVQFNKLYYTIPCNYEKNDCFYDALNKNNFSSSQNINEVSLIMPCSYDIIENEVNKLINNGIKNNKFQKQLRIFMMENSDLMVSKLGLWIHLKKEYGEKKAATLLPFTWDLTNSGDIEKFRKDFDPNKLYITKNNRQRQEGLEIQNNLDNILKSNNKYILVQELLQNPYCVNGRKINLRVYVLVIKDADNNITVQVYKDGFMYYTAELFQKNSLDDKHNITTGYVDRKIYAENPLTHSDFKIYLDSNRNLYPIEQNVISERTRVSDFVFNKIYKLVYDVFNVYNNILAKNSLGVSFQLYGVDVAIDENLNAMMMEINKGPDLSAKDTRDKELKINLSTDILKSVGLLPNTNNNFLTVYNIIDGTETKFI
jgi:hypothetical protein